MISLHIEKITIIPNGQELHDAWTGRNKKQDLWKRETIYMQTFLDTEEPDINKVIRIANGGKE
jgi:hypothetical protein